MNTLIGTQAILVIEKKDIADHYSLGYIIERELHVFCTFNRQLFLDQETFLQFVLDTQARLIAASGQAILVYPRQDSELSVTLEDSEGAVNLSGLIQVSKARTPQQRAIYAVREACFSSYSDAFEAATDGMTQFVQLEAFLQDTADWEEAWEIRYREPYNSDYEGEMLVGLMRTMYQAIVGVDLMRQELSPFESIVFNGRPYLLRKVVGAATIDGAVKTYTIGGPRLSDVMSGAIDSDDDDESSAAYKIDEVIYFCVDEPVFYGDEEALLAYLRRYCV